MTNFAFFSGDELSEKVPVKDAIVMLLASVTSTISTPQQSYDSFHKRALHQLKDKKYTVVHLGPGSLRIEVTVAEAFELSKLLATVEDCFSVGLVAYSSVSDYWGKQATNVFHFPPFDGMIVAHFHEPFVFFAYHC